MVDYQSYQNAILDSRSFLFDKYDELVKRFYNRFPDGILCFFGNDYISLGNDYEYDYTVKMVDLNDGDYTVTVKTHHGEIEEINLMNCWDYDLPTMCKAIEKKLERYGDNPPKENRRRPMDIYEDEVTSLWDE